MLQYLTPDILLFFAGQRVGYVIGEDRLNGSFGTGQHGLIAMLLDTNRFPSSFRCLCT